MTLSEATILAGLVQSPSRLAPNRNPTGAQARAELVLAAMARERLVSDERVKLALVNPAQPVKPASGGSFGYAADHVMDVLDDFIGTIETDVVVSTTLDAGMQLASEKALVDELVQKGDKFGVSQGAFVAMQPDGAIRALVGGRSYAESQYNRAVAARRGASSIAGSWREAPGLRPAAFWKARFTSRSSSEWKETMTSRPPGASSFIAWSSARSISPSSSFTRMRSAWKLRVAP